jgi:intergrase/recombinase
MVFGLWGSGVQIQIPSAAVSDPSKTGNAPRPWDRCCCARGSRSPTRHAPGTVAGTVNAALISYYQSTAFAALAKSTRGNRRAILERFRNDHGDKRIALMHKQALQNILNGKRPAAQRNWKKALRGFIDHCLSLDMIKVDPLAGIKLVKMKKTGGFHTWSEEEIAQYEKRHKPGTKARLALVLLLQTGHAPL